MAMGMVIRDDSGDCLVSASLPLQGFTSPEMAEALALRQAVLITRDRGFSKAIFVTDCLSLIQRLNSTVHDRSQVGVLVKDIKLMAADLSVASFRHVKRSLNEAAHILARPCNLASLGFISNYMLRLASGRPFVLI
jgi:ribonuclease HI